MRIPVGWALWLIVMGLFPSASFAAPPMPSYGTAMVDGNTAEWDLANDFFAGMHRGGDPTAPLCCKAYLRYDCATNTMYVLVLGESSAVLYYNPSGILVGSWVAINTRANKVVTERSGNNGIPPDIAWVGLGYDGIANHVLGLEASFTIQPGSYQIYLFQGVWEGAAASSAATFGYPQTAPPLLISCPVNGACCDSDGLCTFVLQTDCADAWLGDGSSCTPNPCPQPQVACCQPDGTCMLVPQAECADARHGWGNTCTPSPCPEPQGACCNPDGTCLYVVQAECAASGGDWSGYGSACDPNLCAQPSSACCFPDGACQVLTAVDCAPAGGQWLGYGTSCTPNSCLQPPGACCFPDGICQVLTEVGCTQNGGQWLGYGASCTSNPCLQPTEACCFPDGSCRLLTEAECAALNGAWFGLNTNCDPNLCPPPPAMGACCLADGSCEVRTAAACSADRGQYQGDNVPCTPNTCPTSVPIERTSWGRIKSNYR